MTVGVNGVNGANGDRVSDKWNQAEFAKEILAFAEKNDITKFTEADVVHFGTSVRNLVTNYLNYYTGNFPFVLDIQFRHRRSKSLSDAQVKGVLNSALADARRTKAKENPERDREMTLDLTKVDVQETFAVEQVLPCGTYTVVLGQDDTDYVTLRITECNFGDFAEGTQVAAFLSGPDNESSFTRFSIVQGRTPKVWRRFANGYARQINALKILLGAEDPGEFGLAYALRSGNCYKCGRKLTVPASLHAGVGPICARGGRD